VNELLKKDENEDPGFNQKPNEGADAHKQ